MTASFQDAYLRGAALFDDGRFFEAHEAWEERWRGEDDPEQRRLLQGLIQVAAAFHKRFEMGAPDSAARLLTRAMLKLDACTALIAALELEAFCAALRAYARAPASESPPRSTLPRFAKAEGDRP